MKKKHEYNHFEMSKLIHEMGENLEKELENMKWMMVQIVSALMSLEDEDREENDVNQYYNLMRNTMDIFLEDFGHYSNKYFETVTGIDPYNPPDEDLDKHGNAEI